MRTAFSSASESAGVLSVEDIGKQMHINVHKHLNVCKHEEKPNYLFASPEPCAYCTVMLLELLLDT